jgi:hypothetical protein
MKVKITNLKGRNTWIQGKLIEPFKSRILDVPRVDILKPYSYLKIEEIETKTKTKKKPKKKPKMKRSVEPQVITIDKIKSEVK